MAQYPNSYFAYQNQSRHTACPAEGDCPAYYTVQRGETLISIARRHGMVLADLLEANPYLNPNCVASGQVIMIPKSKMPQADGAYTLTDGEGLFDVLRKFNMDVKTFCVLNPGVNPMQVGPGQTVQIKCNLEKGGRWYTLKEGDNLVSVAQRYGVPVSALLSANERLRPSEFVPGMPVRIPD